MRTTINLAGLVLSPILFALPHAGCSEAPSVPIVKPTSELVLKVKEQTVTIPLERMDVYLAASGSSDHDVYEITGAGVLLVGRLPEGVHIGQQENWKALVGKKITISRQGGAPPNGNLQSMIALPGELPLEIMTGDLTVEKSSGKHSGIDGDRAVSGKIRLQLKDQTGQEQEVTGTFTVQGVTSS